MCNSIETILDNLTSYFPKCPDSQLSEDLVIFIIKEFQNWCEENKQLLKKQKFRYSKRGNQTGIIPFVDPKLYDEQVLDKKWFKQNVLPDIDQYLPNNGHEPGCNKKDRTYRLKGFPPNPRIPILKGFKESKKIRQVQCKNCGNIFSVCHHLLQERNIMGSM